MGIQLKKINLNDVFGKIDNKILERAIETDNIQKLKELKQIERNKTKINIFKYFSLCASSFAAIILVLFIMTNNKPNDNEVQIPNPIVSVNSLNELSDYLGINTEHLNFKEIKEINKYNDDILGTIVYADDSVLRMSKGDKNNSGIYGGKIFEETTISGLEIKIYKYENIEYAIWMKDDYSYSYKKAENENIKEIIKEIIGDTK